MAMMKIQFSEEEWDRSMKNFYNKLTHCDVCYIQNDGDGDNGGIALEV